MASKRVNRFRGSRTHGCGSHKKRRGAGSRGGRGMTGAKAHRFVKFLKEKPGHIGKYGFTSHVTQNLKTINLCEMERLADRLGIKEIKLKELGYDKLLGKGALTKPLTVHTNLISSKAREKIEAAGGKAIVPEPKPEESGTVKEEIQPDE